MVAGFLGAEAPKQREKDREERGEGKKKLLWTVVSFPPHINTRIGNLLQIKRGHASHSHRGMRSARIGQAHPSGARPSHRAVQDLRTEREGKSHSKKDC